MIPFMSNCCLWSIYRVAYHTYYSIRWLKAFGQSHSKVHKHIWSTSECLPQITRLDTYKQTQFSLIHTIKWFFTKSSKKVFNQFHSSPSTSGASRLYQCCFRTASDRLVEQCTPFPRPQKLYPRALLRVSDVVPLRVKGPVLPVPPVLLCVDGLPRLCLTPRTRAIHALLRVVRTTMRRRLSRWSRKS